MRQWRDWIHGWSEHGIFPPAEQVLELRRRADELLEEKSINLVGFFAAIDALIATLD